MVKERNSLPVPTTAEAAATAAQTGYGNATEKESDNKPSIKKRVSRWSPRQTRQSCAASTKVSVVHVAEAEPQKTQRKKRRERKQAEKENPVAPSRPAKKEKQAR